MTPVGEGGERERVCVCVCVCARARACTQSCLTLTPWTVACQVPLSVESSRREYWSGLPFPTTRDPPNPGIEPASAASPDLAG